MSNASQAGFFGLVLYEDGLAGNCVNAIHDDPDGILWFGTSEDISRYNGKTFFNLTTEDGLVGNEVNVIYCDADGILWFGAGLYDDNGGVSRYDGEMFLRFATKDGLSTGHPGSAT